MPKVPSRKFTEIELDTDSDSDQTMAHSHTLATAPTVPQNLLNMNTPSAHISENEFRIVTQTLCEWQPGNNLAHFIAEVDELINYCEGKLSPSLQFALNKIIRSKIRGEAGDFLSCVNADGWDRIKTHLLQRYGDQRDEKILSHNLRTCVQLNYETHNQFYSKIIKTLHELIQHIQITISDKNLAEYKIYEYNQTAKDVFLSGVKEPYRSYLRYQNFTTLEQNLNACNTYDNQAQQFGYYDYLRNQGRIGQKQNAKPMAPQTKNQFIPNFSNQNQVLRNHTQPSFSKPFEQQATPRPFLGSINKPLPKTPLHTNRQVFGTHNKPKNPWQTGKPTSNQIRSSQPPPTPMSTTSRNTFRSNWTQHQKPFQTERMIVEELFNAENEYYSEENQHEEEEQFYDQQYVEEIEQLENENFQDQASEHINY